MSCVGNLAYLDGVNMTNSSSKTARKKTTTKKTASGEKGLLQDVIETVDYGLAVWDANQVLVSFNPQFREILSAFPRIETGMTYIEAAIELAETGMIADAVGKEKEWANSKYEEFMSEIGNEFTYETHDGRWISRTDERLKNGGIISIRRDVTDEIRNRDRIHAQELQVELTNATVSNLSSAVVVRDKELKYRLVNDRFSKMYGKSAKEVVGKDAVELFGKEVAASFDSKNLQVIKNGKAYETEETLTFPDGRELIARTEVKRIVTSDGEPYACIIITDISELRSREKSLQEKTAELSLMAGALKSLPSAVMIRDSDMRYQMINGRFFEILGKTESEMIGKTTTEVFGKKIADEYDKRDREIIKTGNPVEYEETFNLPNGTEVSAITTVTRVEDSDGQHYICVTINEVTEIKKREMKLAAQATEIEQHRDKMQQFAETTADWFWETDSNLKFSFLSENVTKSVGISWRELIGKSRRDLWHDVDLNQDQLDHLETLDQRKPFKDFTYLIKNDDGKDVWIAISGTPSFNSDGSFKGFIGSGRNVTEQTLLQQKLNSASTLMSEAASAMSQGLMIYDQDDFELVTPRAIELLDVPEEIVATGMPWKGYVDFLAKRGDFGEGAEAEERRKELLSQRSKDGFKKYIRKNPAGRTLQIEEISRASGGNVVTISDITEQEKITEEVQNNANDMKVTLDSLQMGVVVIDADSNLEMVNDAFHKIWNTSPDDFPTGTKFRGLMDINRNNGVYNVSHDDWEAYVNSRVDEIKVGNVAPKEIERADGVTLLYSVTNLASSRRLITYVDITEQKKS